MRRRAPAPAVKYAPRAHYTAEQLIEFEIKDLEADAADCEARGVMPEYARECRAKIAELKTKLAEASGK